MTTILTPTAEHKVAARDGLWMSAADAEKVTGWTLKPEGMCRAELCVPLPAAAVKGKDVDVAAFWTKLGGPGGRQRGRARSGRWARRPTSATPRSKGLQAPDFTLPDVDGMPRTLSQLRGKKVFLATWASW